MSKKGFRPGYDGPAPRHDSGALEELLKKNGLHRTDVYCHDCNTTFVAQLNYSLNGNHEVECPKCGHHHFRKIVNGVVTSERYDSDHRTHKVENRCVWKSETVPMQTSTASAFLRERWLEKRN